MAKLMKFVALAAGLCCFLPTMATATFWGDWGEREYCPNGEVAVGFSLKTQADQGDGDDTALNSISLKCSGGSWIYSTQGPWGTWGKNFICPSGQKITSCELRVQDEQGDGDDTSVNNVRCYCNQRTLLEGDGLGEGSWRESASVICQDGFWGIQTRVQGKLDGDNTALNDAYFTCKPEFMLP